MHCSEEISKLAAADIFSRMKQIGGDILADDVQVFRHGI
jgi:hypothetical protein